MKTNYVVVTFDNCRYYGTSDNPKPYSGPVYKERSKRFVSQKAAIKWAVKNYGVTRGYPSYQGVGLLSTETGWVDPVTALDVIWVQGGN